MPKIWIVQGSTGEDAAHQEWPVRAYRDEMKAQRLVVEAQARACEMEASRPNRYSDPEGSNEFDPEMKMDYTGTQYTCYPVDLEE